MFAPCPGLHSGLVLQGRKPCPRVYLLQQRTGNKRRLRNKGDTGRCGKRLGAAEVKAQAGVARRPRAILRCRSASAPSSSRQRHAKAPPKPTPDDMSQQQEQQQQQNNEHTHGDRNRKRWTPHSGKRLRDSPDRKLADTPIGDAALKAADSNDSEESPSEDDEELWEEVGDEVPAAWDDSLGSSKSKGKPVQPGDYFTVIKGPNTAAASAQSTSSTPQPSAQAQAAPPGKPEASETKAERLKKRVLAGKGATSFGSGSTSDRFGAGSQLAGGETAWAYTRGPQKWGQQLVLPKGSPVLRLASDFEQQGETRGYFVQMLVDAGLISPDVQRQPDCPEEALGLAVNHCIVRSSTVRGVFNVIRDLLPVFDTVNTATSMHRIAKTGKYDKTSSQEILRQPCYPLLKAKATEQAHRFESRQVANVLWAIASLRDRQDELTHRLDARILKMDLSMFEQQELSNVIWAYGKMKYCNNEELMRRSSVEILRRGLDHFVPQAISNVCWAYAKHDLVYDEFLQEAAQYIAEHMHGWSPQTIANIVWAYGKLNVCHHVLMSAAAQSITSIVPAGKGRAEHVRLEDFKAQEVSNVTHAFAKLGTYNTDVLEAVEQEMSKPERLRDSTTQGIANIMWSFATLRFYPAKFMMAACVALEQRLQDCNDQELSNCLWAVARLAHHPGPSLMTRFCQALDARLASGHPLALQACANMLWALGVLGSANNATAMRIVQFMSQQDCGDLLSTQYHQLFQALLLARIEAQMAGNKQLASSLLIPAALQDEAVRHWKIMMRSSRVSMFHQDVSDVIAAMQIEHQMEYLAEDGIFSVDVAVIRDDQKVAIEVDGPYHYTLNTHQPLGHTLLRRRLLTAIGWIVVSVPYFDWGRLYSGPQKAAYLAKLLTHHGVQTPESAILQPDAGNMQQQVQRGTQLGYDVAYKPDRSNGHGLLQSLEQTGTSLGPPFRDIACRPAMAAQDPKLRKPPYQERISRSQFNRKKVKAFRANTQAEAIAEQPSGSKASGADQTHEAADRDKTGAAASADVQASTSSLPAVPEQEVQSQEVDGPPQSNHFADETEYKAEPQDGGELSSSDVGLDPTLTERPFNSFPWMSASAAEQEAEPNGHAALSPAGVFPGRFDGASEHDTHRQSMLQELDQIGAGADSSYSGASRSSTSKPLKLGLPNHMDRHGELQQMTLVNELRPLCKQYNLPVAGTKQSVIHRIVQHERTLSSESA
ncbi:hypothetical protein WJX77_009701 [Trebouxia sp. C0004]